ncbi:hypothetical protein NBRC10512v2_004206 [Rhodotorula toruloides]
MATDAPTGPVVPTKRVVSKAHLEAWLTSETHDEVVAFVEQLNEAAVGIKLTDEVPASEAVEAVLAVLEEVEGIYNATPPVDNGNSRFGNPAFRDFYDKVASRAAALHSRIPGLNLAYTTELSVYFCECWGNRTRIDYGSGMELNFLLCLQKLGVLKKEDRTAVVIRVFWKYMRIARLLQTGYWLEPAGSHGAQGLDDYHFAVFIFGSAQLRTHKYLRPKAIHDDEILEEFSKDYMYLSYIRYINSIKTASLRWHSPMLDDISGVKTWEKVNSGMLKMYRAEVLAKLPVVQHFLFGSLLPWPPTPELETHREEPDVHVDSTGLLHVRGEGFGDCCNIPIPSAIAASQMAQNGGKGGAAGLGHRVGASRTQLESHPRSPQPANTLKKPQLAMSPAPPPSDPLSSPPHSPLVDATSPRRPSFETRTSGTYVQAGNGRPPPARRRSSGSPTLSRTATRQSIPHAQSVREEPDEEELRKFAELCRRLYYEKDANAAKQVDTVLQKLPAPYRTAYARTMAAVRSAFHRDNEIRRRHEIETLLSSTLPDSTIKEELGISRASESVAALRSSAARKIRRQKLREFVDSNCANGLPGTHTFFKALFGAMWLQAMDGRKGGAGGKCVEWDVDVAVFTEGGSGEAWAKDAVEALKGVLGMTERIREPSHTDSARTSYFDSTASETSSVHHGDPVVAPVIFDHHASASSPSTSGVPHRKQPPPVPPHRGSIRNRSGSDPFLDADEKAAKLAAQQKRQADLAPPAAPLSPVSPSPDAPSASAPLLSAAGPAAPSLPSPRISTSANRPLPSPVVPPQFRTFTLPSYLTNPELRSLCRLFPDFITSPVRKNARFPSSAQKTPATLEAGEAGETKVGHGALRIGRQERAEGWKGTLWERLVEWLRALFGFA